MRFKLVVFLFCGWMILGCSENKNPSELKSLNCTEFKEGKYEMFVDTLRIIVERKDGIQTEKSSLGFSKYLVEWKDDCNYELELYETNIDFSKSNLGKKYQIEITTTNSNQYSYKCTMKGTNFIDVGTLNRLE